jgi:glycine reductase
MPPLNPSEYRSYSVDNLNTLKEGDYTISHNGYDNTFALADPNRLIPLDAMRELAQRGIIGKVHEKFLSTTGLMTTVANSTKIGREMAAYIKEHHIDAAILTST